MAWKHTVTDVFGGTHVLDLEYLVVSSDLHLNHANILKYGRGERWLTLDAHNHAILDALWEATKPRAIEKKRRQLLLLGDLVMSDRKLGLPMLADLGVEVFLVPGNHDNCHPMHRHHLEWRETYRGLGNLVILDEQLTLETSIGYATLCHFPYASIGDHTDEVRYLPWRPQDRGCFLIHGHLHGTGGTRTGPKSVDVGVDAWDYTAPLFTDVLDFLSQPNPHYGGTVERTQAEC